MRLAFLGVRGSTPAPGREFSDYGGHTSCVAVFAGTDDQPRLVLDAGTGLRSLFPREPFVGDIVLSHLHWDHVQGLPFCPSVDHPDARVRLHVPIEAPILDPVALLARAMSPPHFPIGPDGLLGDWQFAPLVAGEVSLVHRDRANVSVAPIEHKGGLAYGIRVELDGAVLAYLPDHALTGASGEEKDAASELARGADLLVHDGQYVAAESAIARDYGHATIEAALEFADQCEVGELILTHHAPNRTDDQIRALAEAITQTPGGIGVRLAEQGMVAPVGRRRVPER